MTTNSGSSFPCFSRDDIVFLKRYLPWKREGSVNGTPGFQVLFYLVIEHLKASKDFVGTIESSKKQLNKHRVGLWSRFTLIPVTVGSLFYYVELLHKCVHYGEFRVFYVSDTHSNTTHHFPMFPP
jgi:hypothetical protein